MSAPQRSRPQAATNVQDDATSRAISDLQQTIADISACVLVQQDSVHKRGIAVPVGVVVVNHGLGRKPVGWIVTRVLGAATYGAEVASDERTLTLSFAFGATIDLLIF